MDNKERKKYIKIGIESIIGVVIFALILLYLLYKCKVLEWKETVMLGISLAGGMIGCIGTLIAVLLTIHETDMMQNESKLNEYIRSAYDNMPVFSIGILKEVEAIMLVEESRGLHIPYDIDKERKKYIDFAKKNMKSYVEIDCIIENISDKFVNIKKYSINVYYNKETILDIYPNEVVKDKTINPYLREKTKEEVGHDIYNYNQPIIAARETRRIKTKIGVKDFIKGEHKDIYVHILLEYENMLKQNFKQELIMIHNDNKGMVYYGNNIPELICNRK